METVSESLFQGSVIFEVVFAILAGFVGGLIAKIFWGD